MLGLYFIIHHFPYKTPITVTSVTLVAVYLKVSFCYWNSIVVYCAISAWVLQYAKTALETAHLCAQSKLSAAVGSAQADEQSEQVLRSFIDANISASAEDSVYVPPEPKKAKLSNKEKLFKFMTARRASLQTCEATLDKLKCSDIKQQYTVFVSDEYVSGRGLEIFNDARFSALRPLARRIFTAPASSAASERVFSRAGLLMRPTRARLSRSNLSQLVFLNCNSAICSLTDSG